MTPLAHSEDEKIPKPLSKNKDRARDFIGRYWLGGRIFGGFWGLLLAGLLGAGSKAPALPAPIAWQVPLQPSETYELEVARDPGFGEVLLRTVVTGASYTWEAPSEGVYHWRLARPKTRGEGGAVITFVSGSFAVIDPALERRRPAQLSWQPEANADRYKLYVIDGLGKARTMISMATRFIVPETTVPLMIEVVPFSGAMRLFRHFHFNPTLSLDSGLPPPPPPPPLEPPADPAIVVPPAVSEPAPSETPEAAEPRTVVETVAPEHPRIFLLHAYGLAGRESLRLQKLDVDLQSTTTVQGGGAGLWLNPISGLVLSVHGSYHEHRAGLRQESLFPGVTMDLLAARHTAELAVGWDILSPLKSRYHRLTLSLASASAQLPFLPLQYQVSDGGAPPVIRHEVLPFLGGSVGYGYFGERVSAFFELNLLQGVDDATRMQAQRLSVEAYVGSSVAILVGAFHRRTEGARCHDAAATCLYEGQSYVTAQEVGFNVGVGGVRW